MAATDTTPEFHRIEPRYRLNSGVDVRVLVQPQGSPEPVDAQLIDMSNSGLQLRLSTCLKFDESMAVHILAGDLQFDLAATVKWLRESDAQNWFIGCHIKPELSEDALNRLASMGLLDRRESVRKEVKLHASICGELEATKTPAVIRNLSEDGFGVSTQTSRVVGQRIRVAVEIGDEDGLEITARVIWQIKTQGGFFCGCAFLNRESHAQLSELVSDDKGAPRRRRLGRPTRRTSMWVALAALVVFVFPSLIVLLMNDQETSITAATPGETIPTPSSAPPVKADTPPKASEVEEPDAPAVTPAIVEASPALPAFSAIPFEVDPIGSRIQNTISSNDSEGSATDEPAADGVHEPPRATEPVSTEAPLAEFSVTPVDQLPSDAVDRDWTPPVVVLELDTWLGSTLGSGFDFDRAVHAAAEMSAAASGPPLTAADPPQDVIADAPPASPADVEPFAPPDEAFRTWVDITGEYHVLAKLVSVDKGMVRLLKKNGRYTSVPLDRLSKTDAEFVKRWLAAPHE